MYYATRITAGFLDLKTDGRTDRQTVMKSLFAFCQRAWKQSRTLLANLV